MILEGVVTTLNADGGVNIAPMGPIVDSSMKTLLLRPFQSSTTFQNLQRTGEGVLHVTDDVLLIARAAIGRLQDIPPVQPATLVTGQVLKDACRWYEFRVETVDLSSERPRLTAAVVQVGRLRDFFGFNRAKHAVIEAAILATRLHLLHPTEVRSQLDALAIPVEKTAGPVELQAFEEILAYVEQAEGNL